MSFTQFFNVKEGKIMRRYENVEIEKLIPYKNNARTHSDEQIEKIAKSIILLKIIIVMEKELLVNLILLVMKKNLSN